MSDIENVEVKEEAVETEVKQGYSMKLSSEEGDISVAQGHAASIKDNLPTNIWLQFDTISIGTPGSEIVTYDLRTIFAGLARLGMLQLVPVENSEEKKD